MKKKYVTPTISNVQSAAIHAEVFRSDIKSGRL